MNYNELVLSKSPNLYLAYDGSATSTGSTAGLGIFNSGPLDPAYEYTIKKHGTKSKKVGHIGSGSYDWYDWNCPDNNSQVKHMHVECWVYITSLTGIKDIWNCGVRPTTGIINASNIYINATTSTIRFFTQSFTGTQDHTLTSTGTVPLNTWTHIACQVSGGSKKIYINGVLDSQATAAAGGVGSIMSEGSSYSTTTYLDGWALWYGTDTAAPANFPTQADILERVNFPSTKTKWWDATTVQWLKSGDEKYWNGTQWVSMQSLPYKY